MLLTRSAFAAVALMAVAWASIASGREQVGAKPLGPAAQAVPPAPGRAKPAPAAPDKAKAAPASQPTAASAPASAPPDALLDRLPGNWNGEQHAGSVMLLETAKWQWTLDQQFLEGVIQASDPATGKVVYQARGLLRVAAGRASLNWFDSNGEVRRYEGPAAADALVLVREALEGRETVTIAKDGDGIRTSFERAATGGHPEARSDSVYKRAIERNTTGSKKKKSKSKDKDAAPPASSPAGTPGSG